MEKKNLNILIVGLGGQGVNLLSTIIQRVLMNSGWYCKGAIFKGGAQKRGAVRASIRVFESEEMRNVFSAITGDGELDVLIALEANEALRYSKLYNNETKILVNEYKFPFYNERFHSKENNSEPIHLLKQNYKNVISMDYNKESQRLFARDNMVNVLMGLVALLSGILPMNKNDYLEEFQSKVGLEYEDMMGLIDYSI